MGLPNSRIFVFILALINFQCDNYVCGQKFGGFDLAKSFIDVSTGIAKKIPDAIPSPDALFSASKNLIAGYPVEFALQAINIFCKFINTYQSFIHIKFYFYLFTMP